MRLITLIFSCGIALASIPASASAASNTFRATSVNASTCPVYERYPDCQTDGSVPWGVYSSSRRSLNCYNPYIGNWKHGYPRDDDSC
jgi:hypothetical protein